jgi:uncharacterized membrane protein YdbT with pleckstrin-like domain
MQIMSYIDNNLLPDEKIIFRTKKHIIIFLVPCIFLCIALFFCMDNHITMAMNNTFSLLTQNIPVLNTIHRIPALLFTLATIVSGFQQWILYQLSDYAVTTKRVIMREGLFDRKISDLRLSTISTVNIDQSILAQLLNYGNIVINGFGGISDQFIQVNEPGEFQRSVHAQLKQ